MLSTSYCSTGKIIKIGKLDVATEVRASTPPLMTVSLWFFSFRISKK